MDLDYVHFFIAIPAIPTPEPNYNTDLFLNNEQFNIAYLANTIPAYHILSPSSPCGNVSTSVSFSFILNALCKIIYCVLNWRIIFVLCYFCGDNIAVGCDCCWLLPIYFFGRQLIRYWMEIIIDINFVLLYIINQNLTQHFFVDDL